MEESPEVMVCACAENSGSEQGDVTTHEVNTCTILLGVVAARAVLSQ